jgi:23S rRNA (pseudouridine1915-N3)-methyltransferase
MQKMTVICVGTLKEDYLRAAVAEYEKRISGYCKLETVCVKEEVLRYESASEIAGALKTEGKRILEAIPKRAYTVALCVEGKQLSSPELAKSFESAYTSHSEICLIIGSSYGLDDEVKAAADMRLSVSKMTFPHRLMRVILLEAVYRAFTISAGVKYHK